jgi:DNA-directed RNA polymerase subunit RPC12/RpoP
MSQRVKKIYKCVECETMITIVTKVHELPESIICPCDSVAENQGAK